MRFRILNSDPLYDYREACKITQGIDLYEESVKNPPKDMTAYWIKQIVTNHSCIRSVHFRLVDTRPKSVIMQIIRATKGHPQPFVQSSRPDWNDGKERSSDPYEEKLFGQDHTPESFIMMSRQRLCKRTEERTRKVMEEIVNEMRKSKNPLIKAIGYCSAPNCVWLGGCPEIKGCNNTKKKSDYFINLYKMEKSI